MANRTHDPVVQRRRLRSELRSLRTAAGMTQREVAEAMDWSSSKLIRMESGDVRIGLSDLRVLLDHYGVADKRKVAELVEMARAARDDPWASFSDVHSKAWLNYLAYESSASIRRSYELTYVPGLLQTEEYAMANYRAFGVPEATAEKRWEARLKRQEAHERGETEMFFVLDEAVVSRLVGGPGIMRRQLERLREFGALRHVSLQVLPFEAGEHPGMDGSFVVLEFAEAQDDALLYIEDPTGGTIERDDADTVADYIERFYALEDNALTMEQTRAWLDRRIDRLKRNGSTDAAVPPEEEAG